MRHPSLPEAVWWYLLGVGILVGVGFLGNYLISQCGG